MEITQLAVSGWFSRALAVAARIGIPDVLAAGPADAAETADRLGTDPRATARLMQMLTIPGVLARDDDGRFTLTEFGQPLRADHPKSVRYFAILSAEMYTDGWGGLLHTVRTGKPGFPEVFGGTIYEYMDGNPDAAEIYDRAMADLARPVAAELSRRHDFTGATTVVDVGGGGGALIRGILAGDERLTGVCADRESVCRRAEADLAADPAMARRLSFRPTDFFVEVPTGGDRYVLKNVLHNWSVDSGSAILAKIREAMVRTAAARPGVPRLLILEPLIDGDLDSWRALFQMVICEEGTRGLDTPGLLAMVDAAGLDVVSRSVLPTGHTLLECVVRETPAEGGAR